MIHYEMPSREDTEPTESAGKDPEFPKQSIVLTDEGKKVIILDYQKGKGLYVVTDLVDRPGIHTPAYRIRPDRLKKIEAEEE